MSCIPADAAVALSRSAPDATDQIRAAVFWAFIMLVIVSPALLGAWILLRP
jgi:hypothetical protein